MNKRLDDLANRVMACVAPIDLAAARAMELGESAVHQALLDAAKTMATIAARIAAVADRTGD